MPIDSINRLLKHEAASGILLFLALLIALICCNTDLVTTYQAFWQQSLGLSFAGYSFTQPMLFWVNEGLMTLFFFIVGLELKREFLDGELSNFQQVVLPAVAAVSGMIVPAVLYCLINLHNPDGLKGWAIPVATDIAFALGVLSLFGRRVPLYLRLFLLTLAIFDDVGAILIIAVFNTVSLSAISLFFAVLCLVGLAGLRWLNVGRISPYLIIGFLLWICVLESGVHATLTGVLLSLMIPNTTNSSGESLLKRLEHHFKPWVDFLVLPLFAFANAGIVLQGVTISTLLTPVVMGIAVGLFVGKQLGVMTIVLLFKRFRWVKFPQGMSWLAFWGVAILCGIGFTMSLFLGTLAFAGSDLLLIEARLGVLLGSLLSSLTGMVMLQIAFRSKQRGA